MERKPELKRSLRYRGGLPSIFLLSGMSILATVLLINDSLIQTLSQVVLAGFFLLASVFARRDKRYREFWEVLFAFFVFASVIVIRNFTISPGFDNQYSSSINGQILIQLVDTLSVIVPIIVLTIASGGRLSSLYLKKGNLRLGLLAGVTIFLIFYVVTVSGFQLIFGNSHGLTITKFLSLTPALLVLVLLNGSREEMWFRGLFLKKYEPLMGRGLSNFLQAPIFALAHYNREYAQFGFVFLVSFVAITFVLGLGLGYLMQKSDSLLGSTLAHAGADVGIYLAIILPFS